MPASFKPPHISSSDITPERLYFSRREFIKTAGLVGTAALLAACVPSKPTPTSKSTPSAGDSPHLAGAATDELGDPLNNFEEITNYNNYYEFSTNKQEVAVLSASFNPSPWQVEVYGLVNSPKTFGIEDLVKLFPQEERIYRLRCVEGWSMVIPWLGFPLSSLLNQVEPLSSAKYVRFESLLDPGRMPGQKSRYFPWPYQEGLRLDEAMHPLTIMATGLYGKSLPNQNGAPVRLVVPWKYGFKSLKAIVKIELVAEQPATFWNTTAPNEYGFYSNVNPEVSHPRWSQSSERRIGETGRRPTLMFNGYAEQVASLYSGMDLHENY